MPLGPELSLERPFPGLRPFGFEDRDYFFGREDQVFALYRLLDLSRFIAVVGSSGSGKSSLVRAGLLPLVYEEAEGPGGRDWRFATLHPGDSPLKQLADALADMVPVPDDAAPEIRADHEVRRERIGAALRRSSFGLTEALGEIPDLKDKSLLIVVDQFEELFRYAAAGPGVARDRVSDSLWRDQATHFVQLLLEVSRNRARSVHVLITMRSDFIGDCARFHGLPEAVSSAQFLVPSLTRDQIEDVIRRPIDKVGASIESELVERLINDAGKELDQLPVLQHCLLRLWNRAGDDAPAGQSRKLTLVHYRDVGGISGALSQHANEVMASLTSVPGLELAVELVFRSLSEVDKEGRATRRALPFAQLLAETGIPKADLVRVLDRFRADDCSFILPAISAEPKLQPDSRIDVVHEALLRRWDRISAEVAAGLGEGGPRSGWLAAEDRDGRFYRALLALLEGSFVAGATLPLDQVEERWRWWSSRPRTEAWAERYGGGLKRVEKLFADSRAKLAEDREQRAAAQRKEREDERRKIEAEEAAKRERLEHLADVERMRADSARAVARRTRVAALFMGVIAILALGLGVYAWQQRSDAVAGQKKLVVALAAAESERHKAQVAQAGAEAAKTRAEQAKRIAEKAQALAVKLQKSADAALAATKVALAQAEVARRAAETALAEANREKKIAVAARSAVFFQSGRQAFLSDDNDSAAVYLAAAYDGDSHNAATQVVLGQALSKLAMRAGSFEAHQDVVTALAYNPRNAQQLATASSDGVKLWDGSGHLLHVFADQGDLITALAFDPSGRYLVTAARDGSAEIHDLRGVTRASAVAPVVLGGHPRRINAVAFSHDGTRIATAGTEGAVKLWKTGGGQSIALANPIAWTTPVYDVAFTRDDRRLVARTGDGTIHVVDASTGSPVATIATTSHSPLTSMALAPDGTRVAGGAADGTLMLYDMQKASSIAELNDRHGSINALAFDASGQRLVTANADGTGSVLDGVKGVVVSHLPAPAGDATAMLNVAFDPVDETIVATYGDGSIAFLTPAGRSLARFHIHPGEAWSPAALAFAPGGNTIVTGANNGEVFWWHPRASLAAAPAAHHAAVESIVFSRDGRRFVTASRDGTAALWLPGPKPVREKTLAHAPGTAWVVAANFSSDGKRIVTAAGGTVKIWSTDGGTAPLATIVPTATKKRFSQALFLGDQPGVIVAQRGDNDPDETQNALTADKWFVWSPDGKRELAQQPYWLWDIRSLQVTRNGYFALATSAADYVHFTWVNGNWNYNQWNGVSQAALANDHFFYALGKIDGGIVVESLTGALMKTLPGHQGRVSALAFSPDDRWLASAGSGDLLGKVWDVQNERLHATLTGHDAEIESIAFAPVDPFVLTTSLDGTAKLWNRDTGDLLASESIPGEAIRSAAFGPGGRTVVLGGSNGGVYVWNLQNATSPENVSKNVLDAVRAGEHAGAGSAAANPLLAQAEDQVATIAGAHEEMMQQAGQDSATEGLRALTADQPTRAANDLVPAFIANSRDPSLRLSVAALSARFGSLRATLRADSERIEKVAFADNGTRLVTGSFDKMARVWDPRTGRPLQVLGPFDSLVGFLSAQTRGRLALVAGLGDSEFRVWDIESGRELRRIAAGSVLRGLSFNPDGSRAIGYGSDSVVRVWDVASGKKVREFRQGFAFAGGNTVAIKDYPSGKMGLWDAGAGRRIVLLDLAAAHDTSALTGVGLHRTLPLAMTVQTNVVRIWDRRTGRLLRTLKYPKKLSWAGFGSRTDLVGATGDAGVAFWRAGRMTGPFVTAGLQTDRYGGFSDDERRFFSTGTNRAVAMWDVDGGRLLAEFSGTDSAYMTADITADGSLLATAGDDGVTHVWNTAAGAPSGTRVDIGTLVGDIQMDASAKRLLVVGVDGSTFVWDVASSKQLWRKKLSVGNGGEPWVRIVRDGAYVTAISQATVDKQVHWSLAVLGVNDGGERHRYAIDAGWTQSASGRYVAWYQGTRMAVLDTTNGRRADWTASDVHSVRFGSDDVLVTMGQAHSATLYRRDGTRLVTLGGAGLNVQATSSSDGRRLLTFGAGMNATLWDVARGKPTAIAILYSGGSGDATAAEFNADGTRVLTTGSDGVLRLWATARGDLVTTFGGGSSRLTRGRFSPDERFVVATLENGGLTVWDARRKVLTFPNRSTLAIMPQAFGNLNLVAADGTGVIVYRIGAVPTAGATKALRARLVEAQR